MKTFKDYIKEEKISERHSSGNYYEDQLFNLQTNGYPIKVKFFGDNSETKYIDINKESLPVIMKYLETLKNSDYEF